MKFSYNWLKELSESEKNAEEVAELFLVHSFEVEGIEYLAKGLDKVVIGEVLAVEKHPDADRLNVAKVNVGKENGGELQIVCGAPNLAVGQKVPVALVGAKIRPIIKTPTDKEEIFEIKKSKIRGIESNGMICAEDELGLGEEHEGIIVLSENAKVGQELAEYLQLKDKILDIDILPNRAHDCLSYSGVAKELRALENKIEKNSDKKKLTSINTKVDVNLETKKCSRYIGAKIEGVKISPSPDWIQARLKISDIKPINNIVDITNYVMLLTGQPLHAFDASKISKISVRQANKNEKLKLLDEQLLKLNKEDVIITDGENPIALAGVMGGMVSGISNKTVDIILESANFNSTTIRRTRTRYNIQSDAAYRFERNIDPNLAEEAMIESIKLIIKIAGGKVTALEDKYPSPVKPWEVSLEFEKVEKLLGIEISKKEIVDILQRLEINIAEDDKNLKCTIPTRRVDLKTTEDLIEEIGRIYGYNKISPKPLMGAIEVPHKNKKRFFERMVKDVVVQSGFDEIRGYSFYSEKNAEVLGLKIDEHMSLLNPMNPDQSLIRQTLIVDVLKFCKKNLSYFKDVRLFDIGKVYTPQKIGLPKEQLLLTMAVTEKGEKGEQFFTLKEAVENLFREVRLADWFYVDKFENNIENKLSFHPSRKALIKISSNKKVIGVIGEINKQVARHFGFKNVRVAIAEIDLSELLKELTTEYVHQKLAKFPSTDRDLSMIVPEKTRVADVEKTLYLAGEKLITNIELFDLYVNPKTNEQSMAFRLTFSHPERTLTTAEVDKQVSKIINIAKKELKIEIKK